MFSDISSIAAYLLHTYAANANTHICLLGSKTNLLKSCFGGWITHVWELSVRIWGLSQVSLPQASPCPRLMFFD